VEKKLLKLNELLTTDESIVGIAIQKKPVNISPDAIALTNKRIIIYRLKNHGQTMNFDDIFWREVADCHLKERVICWRFETRTVKKAHYYIDFLPKSQARRIYRYAQEEERMIAYHR